MPNENLSTVITISSIALFFGIASLVIGASISGVALTKVDRVISAARNITYLQSTTGILQVDYVNATDQYRIQNITAYVYRSNAFVTIMVSNFTTTCAGASSYALTLEFLPAWTKPANVSTAPSILKTSIAPKFIYNNSTVSTGLFYLGYDLITNSYYPEIYVVTQTGAAFASTGNCGWDNLVYEYTLFP